jgi:hypothetical protein
MTGGRMDIYLTESCSSHEVLVVCWVAIKSSASDIMEGVEILLGFPEEQVSVTDFISKNM